MRIMSTLAAIGLLTIAAASPCAAAEVRWVETPTANDFAANYPPKAAASFLGGVASIQCRVTGEGRLADCQVLSESPADAGFGPAALVLSAKLKLAVQPGSPTEIVLPVRFEPPIRQAEPIFRKDPDHSDLGGSGPFYPRQAELAGVGGAAALQCVLRSSGVLDQCQLLSENPPHQDFGNAALVMARKRWMTASPRLVDGRPLEQETVQVVVPFGRGAR